jgi:hypothetical protein
MTVRGTIKHYHAAIWGFARRLGNSAGDRKRNEGKGKKAGAQKNCGGMPGRYSLDATAEYG